MASDNSQRKTGIVLSYVNQILGNLIPIAYTPIMLSLLGQSEYGLYKLATSATSYLTLATFGIGSAVTRYLIKAKFEGGDKSEEKMFGLFHIIFQMIAIFTFAVGMILAFNLHYIYSASLTDNELHRMQILIVILTINTAIGFSASAYNAVVTSHERFIFLQIVNILSTCVAPCLNIVALYLGYASIGMAISTLLVNVLIRVIYLVYVSKEMNIHPCYRDMPTNIIWEILTFSFWVFVANIVSRLYNTTDTMIIGAIPALATTGVAVYNVGATFNTIVYNLAQAISTMYTLLANKLVFSGANSSALTDLVIRIGRIQGYITTLVCSGFVAFGRPFIEWYVGGEYYEAYWVAILMMIPSCVPLVQSVALSITQAKNMHRFRSIVYLFIAILNVVGTYLLVHQWGIIGAAAMTGIANIIGQGFIMNWYYWKRVKLDIPRFWKEFVKIIWIPVLLCIVTLLVSNSVDFYNFGLLVSGILIYTLVFFVLNWTFVMNEYEKNNVSKIIRKVIKSRNYR